MPQEGVITHSSLPVDPHLRVSNVQKSVMGLVRLLVKGVVGGEEGLNSPRRVVRTVGETSRTSQGALVRLKRSRNPVVTLVSGTTFKDHQVVLSLWTDPRRVSVLRGSPKDSVI